MAKKAIAPKYKMRNQKSLLHHLFKAEVAKYKDDKSWDANVLQIHEIEHAHHYHSINSAGHTQKYTNTVGKHFHEIIWDESEGEPVARCGPPLTRKVVGKGLHKKTTFVPVKFEDRQTGGTVSDSHTHTMTYLGTDQLNRQAIEQIQQANLAFVNQAASEKFDNDEVTMVEND